MPIEISCTCGRALKLRDELAGKVIRCPQCAGNVQVPLPAVEVVEEVVAGPPPLPSASSNAGSPQRKVNQLDVAPPVLTPPKPKEPKKKKKKKSVYSEFYGGTNDKPLVALDEGWFGSTSSGLIGGGITLLIGILLAALFIAFGVWRLWYYPIFLIAVGIIAMLKGLLDMFSDDQ
jgi:hypothetical protein